MTAAIQQLFNEDKIDMDYIPPRIVWKPVNEPEKEDESSDEIKMTLIREGNGNWKTSIGMYNNPKSLPMKKRNQNK